MQGDHRLLTLAAHEGALPAPYSFEEFERRAGQVRGQARRRERRAGAIALASLMLALAGGLLHVGTKTPAPRPESARRPADLLAEPQAAPAEAMDAERWLASAPSEPVVVRVGVYAAVAALEDRIAFIDDSMNDNRLAGDPRFDSASLARERARLINTLASVRYAQAVAGALN